MAEVEIQYALFRVYPPGTDMYHGYPQGFLYETYSGPDALQAAEKNLAYFLRNDLHAHAPYTHEIRMRTITKSAWEPFIQDKVFED